MHCFVLRKLVNHLQLSQLTLVCQDWGGLVGLSVVKDAPDMFANLVIMNTGLPSGILNFSEDMGDTASGPLPFLKLLQGVSNFSNSSALFNFIFSVFLSFSGEHLHRCSKQKYQLSSFLKDLTLLRIWTLMLCLLMEPLFLPHCTKVVLLDGQ